MSRLTKPAKKSPAAASLTGRLQVGDHVIALSWSPDGKTLAAAAVSGAITLFDTQTGKANHTLPGHDFGTTQVVWDAPSGILASAGQDGKIRFWDAEASVEQLSLAGGAAWVEHLAWSPKSNVMASAAGKKLKLWNHRGELLREYPDHDSTISDVAWKPDGSEIVASAYGGLVFWSPAHSDPLRRYEWKGSTLVIAWSPDGRYVATGDQDSTVHFWITKNGKDLQMWGYPTKVRELAWNWTSRYLATGGAPQVTVWDCASKGPEGTTPLQLDLHREFVSALAYQHKGHNLASGAQDGTVGIWSPTAQKALLGQAKFDSGITQLAWSPDDRMLAVGCESGAVEVFHAS